jgi:hypothetical protein
MKRNVSRAVAALCLAIIIVNLIIVAVGEGCYTVDPYVYESGRPGMTVLVIAGAHGNELSGPKAVRGIIQDGVTVKNGRLILIPYANWCGIIRGTRKVPEKGGDTDLNRSFATTPHKRLAASIVRYVREADYVLDLHESGDYYRDGIGTHFHNGRTLWSNKRRYLNEVVANEINASVTSGPPFALDVGAAYMLDDMLRDYCMHHDIPYLLVETCKKDPLNERIAQNRIAIETVIRNMDAPSLSPP